MKWSGNVVASQESQPKSPPLPINAGIYKVGRGEHVMCAWHVEHVDDMRQDI